MLQCCCFVPVTVILPRRLNLDMVEERRGDEGVQQHDTDARNSGASWIGCSSRDWRDVLNDISATARTTHDDSTSSSTPNSADSLGEHEMVGSTATSHSNLAEIDQLLKRHFALILQHHEIQSARVTH